MSIDQNGSNVREKNFILFRKWKLVDDGVSVLRKVI